MKKITLLLASLFLVLVLSTGAMAAPITGISTMIDPSNIVYPGPTSMRQHMPITGSIASSLSSSLPIGSSGTMTIDPFMWFGITGYIHGFSGPSSPIDVVKISATEYEAHMLWDWGTTFNIDVITRWRKGYGDAPSDWQAGGAYPAVAATDTNDWQFAMVDDDGDSISGHAMWNGMTVGWNWQFDFNVIPEPSSLLLLGTGIAALIGIARRRGKPSK